MNATAYNKRRAKARSRALLMGYHKRLKLVQDNKWTNRGHWDNWLHPDTGWNYNLVDAVVCILLK